MTVVRATGLKAADSNGLSDPYVKVAAGKRTAKTSVVKKTLNPTYNAALAFHFDDVNAMTACETIGVQAWDWDMVGRDDALGQGAVALAPLSDALLAGARLEQTVALDDKQRTNGSVHLVLSWEYDPELNSLPILTEFSGVLNVHVSHAIGLRAADANGLSDPYVKLYAIQVARPPYWIR